MGGDGTNSMQVGIATSIVTVPLDPYFGITSGIALGTLTYYVKTNGKLVTSTLKNSSNTYFTVKINYQYVQADSNDGYYYIKNITIV